MTCSEHMALSFEDNICYTTKLRVHHGVIELNNAIFTQIACANVSISINGVDEQRIAK